MFGIGQSFPALHVGHALRDALIKRGFVHLAFHAGNAENGEHRDAEDGEGGGVTDVRR